MPELNWNPPKIESTCVEYTWGNAEVDYAADVHLGVTYVGGARGVARPWTDVAISESDLPEMMQENFSGDVREAFLKTAEQLGDKFKDVIDNYDWQIEGNQEKAYRPGQPTWKTITDSGALRDSQHMEVID